MLKEEGPTRNVGIRNISFVSCRSVLMVGRAEPGGSRQASAAPPPAPALSISRPGSGPGIVPHPALPPHMASSSRAGHNQHVTTATSSVTEIFKQSLSVHWCKGNSSDLSTDLDRDVCPCSGGRRDVGGGAGSAGHAVPGQAHPAGAGVLRGHAALPRHRHPDSRRP